MAYSKDDVNEYVIGPDFGPQNPGFLTEQNMVRDKKLVYSHHSEHRDIVGAGYKFVVQYKSAEAALVTGRMEARNATCWYRAMPKSAYQYLKKNNCLEEEDAYGGVATNETYVKEYMSNLGTHSHLVQFNFGLVKLHDLMRAHGQANGGVEDAKAEGNGGTFGLGKTGHYKGAGLKIFNDELQNLYDWKLTHVYLKVK